MSPAEHEARDKAAEVISELYGRHGAGFVLATIGKRIKQTNDQFNLSAVERERVREWAHDMLEEGIQS
jgi:hypothetical protein